MGTRLALFQSCPDVTRIEASKWNCIQNSVNFELRLKILANNWHIVGVRRPFSRPPVVRHTNWAFYVSHTINIILLRSFISRYLTHRRTQTSGSTVKVNLFSAFFCANSSVGSEGLRSEADWMEQKVKPVLCESVMSAPVCRRTARPNWVMESQWAEKDLKKNVCYTKHILESSEDRLKTGWRADTLSSKRRKSITIIKFANYERICVFCVVCDTNMYFDSPASTVSALIRHIFRPYFWRRVRSQYLIAFDEYLMVGH